ncbi:siderophore-interacting protein [Streptomyces scopuliridis]|uniref:siderophore-interacting protein n=1 Tax=Streptomyces scopuliridis TaxID=452529 RepID=UPI0036B0D621
MTDAPFQFFTVEVLRTERVTPSMARVVLGGPDMARMATAGRDQRVKLFLPRPGEREPVMPDPARADWYDAWRELDPDVRGIMRTYTVRELRRDPHELVIDFALHGTESNGQGSGGSCGGGTAVDTASGPAAGWVLSGRYSRISPRQSGAGGTPVPFRPRGSIARRRIGAVDGPAVLGRLRQRSEVRCQASRAREDRPDRA